jgi:hypothetical protein
MREQANVAYQTPAAHIIRLRAVDDNSGNQPKRGARAMNDPVDPATQAWFGARSIKAKTAFRKHVTALLDALAPEKILGKADPVKLVIEEHRTPDGCVLQAPDAALQVSWYAERDDAPASLHVVVWKGVVSRRGAPPRGGATVALEEVYSPVEGPTDDKVWRRADGTLQDTQSLAEHCLALLEKQSQA